MTFWCAFVYISTYVHMYIRSYVCTPWYAKCGDRCSFLHLYKRHCYFGPAKYCHRAWIDWWCI